MKLKHLLSTNLTEDKANDRLDDTPFTTARLTPETRARFQEASQTAVKALIKTIKLPMLIGAYILLGLGLLVLSAFIKALPDAGLSTALRNAWWILLIGVALAAAGGILLAKGILWGAALLLAGVYLVGRPFGFSKRLRQTYDDRPDDIWEKMLDNKEDIR